MNTNTNTNTTGPGTDEPAIDHAHDNRQPASGGLGRTAQSGRRPINDRGGLHRHAPAAQNVQPSRRSRRKPKLATIFGLGWLSAILGVLAQIVLECAPSDPEPSVTFIVIVALVPLVTGVVSIVLALLYWRCPACNLLLRSNGFEIPQYCAKCGSGTGV